MRINYEAKLNFEDVLLQPKRSTLTSRKDVDMTRKFTFRNSGKVMNFTPIFASNMDGVGTFSMAKVLQEYKMMTVLQSQPQLINGNKRQALVLDYSLFLCVLAQMLCGIQMHPIIKQ